RRQPPTGGVRRNAARSASQATTRARWTSLAELIERIGYDTVPSRQRDPRIRCAQAVLPPRDRASPRTPDLSATCHRPPRGIGATIASARRSSRTGRAAPTRTNHDARSAPLLVEERAGDRRE